MADFTTEQLAEFREIFNEFDIDKNGSITSSELGTVLTKLGENVPGFKLREMIAEIDKDNNGTVEWNEFLAMLANVRKGKEAGFNKVVKKVEQVVKVGGSSEASAAGTTHSFSEDEKVAFVDWINDVLGPDEDLKGFKLVPVSEDGDALFKAVNNGILMCKLINSAVSDTVDERAINKKKLNTYTIHENQTLSLNSAKAIGCSVVNIGAQDLIDGKSHLVLGLIWQIIRIGLFARINLQSCPGLARLLEGSETLDDLMALPADQILIRWVNFHLKEAGSARRIGNFSKDISDSEAYTILLKQIAPKNLGVDTSPLNEQDLTKRAEKMLKN
eukprot:Opistho-2@71190